MKPLVFISCLLILSQTIDLAQGKNLTHGAIHWIGQKLEHAKVIVHYCYEKELLPIGKTHSDGKHLLQLMEENIMHLLSYQPSDHPDLPAGQAHPHCNHLLHCIGLGPLMHPMQNPVETVRMVLSLDHFAPQFELKRFILDCVLNLATLEQTFKQCVIDKTLAEGMLHSDQWLHDVKEDYAEIKSELKAGIYKEKLALRQLHDGLVQRYAQFHAKFDGIYHRYKHALSSFPYSFQELIKSSAHLEEKLRRFYLKLFGWIEKYEQCHSSNNGTEICMLL